jgi:hypothetical protein
MTGAFVVSIVIKATVMLAFGLGALRVLHRSRAALRHLFLLALCAVVFLLPIAALVLPVVEKSAVESLTPCQWLHRGTHMCTLCFRGVTAGVLAVGFLLGQAASASAQQRATAQQGRSVQQDDLRSIAIAIEPVIATRIEGLLALPNTVLVADYYYIDTRFGPNLRIDAVIVEAVGSPARLKGLRVQVRDEENRRRQEGTSYMDLEELQALSSGVTAMAELADQWTGRDDRRASELTFTSNGGFKLAIRQSARLPRAYLSTGLLDPVATSIELNELGTLKLALDQALAILLSK